MTHRHRGALGLPIARDSASLPAMSTWTFARRVGSLRRLRRVRGRVVV